MRQEEKEVGGPTIEQPRIFPKSDTSNVVESDKGTLNA
jgi:hypothetical protein